MKASKTAKNILSKVPQLLIFMVVLFGLSFNSGSIFGHQWSGQDNEHTGLAEGYGGVVHVEVSVDSTSTIRSVKVGENNETPKFLARVEASGLLDSWNGMKITQVADHRVDAVSGATFTSQAVIANARARFAELSSLHMTPTDIHPYDVWSMAAAFVVVGLSLVCYFFPGRTRRLRIITLIVSIIVLGFWQGSFVSIELLYSYLINGSSLSMIVPLVVVVLALILPLVFSRSYYCAHLCPFGAAQELVGKLPIGKLNLSARVRKWLVWIRRATLLTFIVLLFTSQAFIPAQWEPFTVFIVRSASVSVILIAVASLLLSIFVPRAYCRFVCPTGELLSLFQNQQKLR